MLNPSAFFCCCCCCYYCCCCLKLHEKLSFPYFHYCNFRFHSFRCRRFFLTFSFFSPSSSKHKSFPFFSTFFKLCVLNSEQGKEHNFYFHNVCEFLLIRIFPLFCFNANHMGTHIHIFNVKIVLVLYFWIEKFAIIKICA